VKTTVELQARVLELRATASELSVEKAHLEDAIASTSRLVRAAQLHRIVDPGAATPWDGNEDDLAGHQEQLATVDRALADHAEAIAFAQAIADLTFYRRGLVERQAKLAAAHQAVLALEERDARTLMERFRSSQLGHAKEVLLDKRKRLAGLGPPRGLWTQHFTEEQMDLLTEYHIAKGCESNADYSLSNQRQGVERLLALHPELADLPADDEPAQAIA
jgi:hypothetical protein